MKIEANKISVRYELSGGGRCFTLIHGAGGNLNMWYNQVPAFSQLYQVLTYDVRGARPFWWASRQGYPGGYPWLAA